MFWKVRDMTKRGKSLTNYDMTDEQFKLLSTWEKNFDTAIRGNWAMNPGLSACEAINRVLNSLRKKEMKLNYNCGNCVLALLKEAGEVYFKEKEKRAAEIEPKEEEVKPVVKPRKVKNTKK